MMQSKLNRLENYHNANKIARHASLKKSTVFIFVCQFVSLVSYLFLNIINVGQSGGYLNFLGFYVVISVLFFGYLAIKRELYFGFWFLPFLMLFSWFVFRIIIDLQDMEYLKQVTVATTGGIILFLALGSLLSQSVLFIADQIQNSVNKRALSKLVLFLLLVVLAWCLFTIFTFLPRLRSDIFYLTDVGGLYQRPGNFASIAFIITSFIFYYFRSMGCLKNSLKSVFISLHYIIYTLIFFLLLIAVQMFGSNNATVVITGVYLLTLVLSLGISGLSISKFSVFSIRVIRSLFVYGSIGFLGMFIGLTTIVLITGFDITSIRLLGFGRGTITSLVARYEILAEQFWLQAFHSPILGNLNVTLETTGRAGSYVHSFLLYTITHLGLIGMTLALLMFIGVFWQLYCKSRASDFTETFYSIYGFYILLFLFLFANIAVSFTWAPLWFALGFLARPIRFKTVESSVARASNQQDFIHKTQTITTQ